MDNLTVWVVDDDVDYLALIEEVLQDDYLVQVFDSAAAYLAALESATPEIILMDINLPDSSGVELCAHLQSQGREASVVFVSGMNTLNERLKAYEAGAVDFIAKPFELKELLAKVRSVAQYQQRKQSLMQAESMSRNMAFQSMSESSQYGCVLQFFRQCFLCNNYRALADAFFELMTQLNLNTCLEIRTDSAEYFVPDNTQISPIEANIFELLDKQGRLYDFGNRTMCNDKHVSFLIKNMPVKDEVLYGRLRDVIAVVVEGLEARVLDIERQQMLRRVMDRLHLLMKQLGDSMQQQDQRFCDTLSGITTEIRNSFHVLDMTEEQESYFTSMVERHLREASSAGEAFNRIRGSLKEMLVMMEESQGG
ncbi:TPA: response regulator [Shewanella algae]|uniref:response regulator transcription factor n=1 Tax=Shewanella algae TaxID=38313 RepID=UPI001C598625|nr:response regulator [Shewanella algae]HDS1211720.1 response regulator [Shewanella algae]